MAGDKGMMIKEVFDRSARERFVPVTRKDIVAALVGDVGQLPPEDRKHFAAFCELYGAVFHQRFHSMFEKIKKSYSPYSPDQEFVQFDKQSPETEKELLDTMFNLLNRTNYEHIEDATVRELMAPGGGGSGMFGLKMFVDLQKDYEWLHVFYRGSAKLEVTKKRLFGLIKPKQFTVDAFQRVVIFFKLKGEDKITIKTFRQVPREELEMVMPTTSVGMRLIDKILLSLTGLAGLATVIVKLIKGGGGAGMVAILIGLGMAGVKVGLGYLNKKRAAREIVFRQLYFKNLANNLGVVSLLVDQAEEEETKEALLGWFFLRQARTALSEEEMDKLVEKYILDKFGFDADYESGDGLRKLREEKLLIDGPDGKMTVVSAEQAYAALDEYWDNVYNVENASQAQDLLARKAD